MDITTLKAEPRPETTGQLDLWVMVLTIWHALLAVGSLGAVLYLWSDANAGMAGWVRILLTVAAVLVAAGSAVAAVLVMRRDRRGRLLSIAVNYLLFIATLVLLLAAWGVFAGLDSLADTFIRGLPFLVVIFLGWFVSSSLAERYEDNPQRSHWLKLGGRVVVWAGVAGFLYAIGIFSGLTALASKYTDLRPILLTVLLILLGVMLWAMWRQPMAETIGRDQC